MNEWKTREGVTKECKTMEFKRRYW